MKKLLIGILLLLGLVSCTQKQVGTSTLSVQTALTPDLVISCNEEDVDYMYSPRRVSLKSASVQIDIKIIKKNITSFKSWLGVTDSGNYYLLTSFMYGEYTSIVLTPVTKDIELINGLPRIVFTNLPICE